jgi:iron complex transport system substrate-binding protein
MKTLRISWVAAAFAVVVGSVVSTTLFADEPSYATGFSFQQFSGYTVVTVKTPWQGAGPADARRYVLHRRGTPAPRGYNDATMVEVPVQRVVTMSTTFLPHVEMLDELETLVGHDSLAWIYSPAVRGRAAGGEITEIGSGTMVDVELALQLKPDVIFVNSYGGDWDAHPALERAGLPTVISGDWVEQSPLGRAEWLIFTGLFYGKLDEARETFARIETEYLELKTLATSVSRKPSVLINAPYQGTWSIAGGDSYAAQFIRDAGADYVWSRDTTAGALFLDFETVFAEAGDADIWINPGVWSSLSDGLAEDARFARFRAFEDGSVFNNNRRVSATGGIDYFESGAANPQVVLRDLVSLFHPELLPGYEPFYYQKLE